MNQHGLNNSKITWWLLSTHSSLGKTIQEKNVFAIINFPFNDRKKMNSSRLKLPTVESSLVSEVLWIINNLEAQTNIIKKIKLLALGD